MKNVIILIAIFILSACSTMNTNSDYNPSVNFDKIKHYAWIVKKDTANGYHMNGLMDQRIKNAVDYQLQLKGMVKTEASHADVLINYLTKIDKKIDINTFNTNYGYNPYYGHGWVLGGNVQTQTTVREYQVGTLIVDIIDNTNDKLIWRGSVADIIDKKHTPQERVDVINKAVAAMMANYPPKIQKN